MHIHMCIHVCEIDTKCDIPMASGRSRLSRMGLEPSVWCPRGVIACGWVRKSARDRESERESLCVCACVCVEVCVYACVSVCLCVDRYHINASTHMIDIHMVTVYTA